MVVDAIIAWRVDWVQLRTDQSQRSKVAVAHNMDTVFEQKRGGDTDATPVPNWLFKPTTNRDDLRTQAALRSVSTAKSTFSRCASAACAWAPLSISCQVDSVLV